MRALLYLLALIVGAVAGAAGVGLWQNRSDALDAGDWLQFGGTAAGVALTVLLTLGVELFRQSTARRRAISQILRTGRNVRQAAGACTPIENDPRPLADRVAAAHTAQWALKRATGQFLYAVSRVDIEDIALWQAVQDAKNTISAYADRLDRELRLIGDAPTEAVFNINQAEINLPVRSIEFSMLALAHAAKNGR